MRITNLDAEARWQPIAQELAQQLQRLYGPRFRGLVLYGSWARGEATEESDVDFLVLLEDYEDFWHELRCIGEIAWQLSCRYDVTVSAFPARASEYRDKVTPFFLNVRREGVLVG